MDGEHHMDHSTHGDQMAGGHEHHAMPTEGFELTSVALSATLHCLTGCAIGEVTGMVIGTALGFSDLGTIALAVSLAFLFGYTLTSIPLLRAGMALSAVIPVAFAADTISIAIMEIVDNGIMLVIPGAMESGVGSVLFWGALSFALVIAGLFALPVNRWLIARGKGHTAVHRTGIHGGPPVKVVGAVAVVAFIFGSAVLLNEAINGDGMGHGEEEMHAGAGGHQASAGAATVRGLSSTENGTRLELQRSRIKVEEEATLAFSIVDQSTGATIRDFEIEHTKRMHLIVVRRDMVGFQHLHPELGEDGIWRTKIVLPDAGDYRVYADFTREETNTTLATDLAVMGAPVEPEPLRAPARSASASGGYTVTLEEMDPEAGEEADLAFVVERNGEVVDVEPYLGADGHLVALRRTDLAYLHTHPTEAEGHEDEATDGEEDEHADAPSINEAIRFATTFPSPGSYRLFLQFRDAGEVRTVAFTREVH